MFGLNAILSKLAPKTPTEKPKEDVSPDAPLDDIRCIGPVWVCKCPVCVRPVRPTEDGLPHTCPACSARTVNVLVYIWKQLRHGRYQPLMYENFIENTAYTGHIVIDREGEYFIFRQGNSVYLAKQTAPMDGRTFGPPIVELEKKLIHNIALLKQSVLTKGNKNG